MEFKISLPTDTCVYSLYGLVFCVLRGSKQTDVVTSDLKHILIILKNEPQTYEVGSSFYPCHAHPVY